MKTCIICKTEKPVEEFGLIRRSTGKTYVRGECKSCCKEKLKAYKATEGGKENHRARMRRKSAEQKLLANAALEAIKAGTMKDPRC